MNISLVAETDKYTVVGSYEPAKRNSLAYESEAQLEKRFIALLSEQGYEYLTIHTEEDLINNLRRRLESLNHITFSDSEWKRFFSENIANEREFALEKTRKIQEDYIQAFTRDDGTIKNIRLIDKQNIHNNYLQVINQYEAGTSSCSSDSSGSRACRYDVTVLVNGLPLVHIELKRRGVAIREAFNQIRRYARDSFWSGSGLFSYVQIFVISNGTHTKYYSNTTRMRHLNEFHRAVSKRGGLMGRKFTSNSFEFTSWWADAENRPIEDLVDFARTFFSKHVLLNILTRYCVFDTNETLLVMRPYQIAATERIISRIVVARNHGWEGSAQGGGYIWHTTGSGKTLTSFKTALLASKMEGVGKVLFVVDRSDLDYQTIKEYDRFQKGAANSNTSTKILEAQLLDPNAKIIITTIQKLGLLCGKAESPNSQLSTLSSQLKSERFVLIFDECHRSQFGELHRKIVKVFRKYHIFGFTGTPIFAANATSSATAVVRTTPQAFGDQLHAYTIVDAIRDGNVLPFRISTVNTVKMKEGASDKSVEAIDTEEAMLDPRRVSAVVRYILENYGQKTYGRFNSILAVSSIPAAMRYYDEFKRQMSADGARKLKVATIFTYSANEDDVEDGHLDSGGDPSQLPQQSRDFLESAIGDYNAMFDTAFDTSGERFQNYYRDVSLKVKTRQIDVLIVVNMFLTGFDATTLNTLWVDKNLKMHGLIQAYSRTNRILDSVKKFGNIICFRDLQEATDEAIALFGDKNARGLVLIRTFDEYFSGYTDSGGRTVKGYAELVAELVEKFPLGRPIATEEDKKAFISLWGGILRMRNILSAFDDFEGREILADRDRQDYQSVYIDLYDEFRGREKAEKESITDDIEFEMELVRQVDVNIDYILMLIEKYRREHGCDKELKGVIDKAIGSSVHLRSKRELIEAFIADVNADADVAEAWMAFVEERKKRDLTELIEKERLKAEETVKFFESALKAGMLKTTGTEVDLILPAMSRFGNVRKETKERVISALQNLFERYKGL